MGPRRAHTRNILLVAAMSPGPMGCLLLSEPPDFDPTDDCLSEDLGSALGATVIAAPASTRPDPGCYEDPEDMGEAVVFAWTSPASATYSFRASGPGLRLRINVNEADCTGGRSCSNVGAGAIEVEEAVSAGDERHIAVETTIVPGASFSLAITKVEAPSCASMNDGNCDEPVLCPSGTDMADCFCEYTNDGWCDEPEGSDLCAEGTDLNDC